MELEFKMQEWTYRTLPNKMYELVHNTGDLNKKGTGYLTDAESEMLTILNYLNFDEKTGITESMIAQIDKAIRDSANDTLQSEDMGSSKAGPIISHNHMPAKEFVEQMNDVVNVPAGTVYFSEDDVEYTVNYSKPGKPMESVKFGTLVECRKYLESLGCTVRMANRSEDPALIETWI